MGQTKEPILKKSVEALEHKKFDEHFRIVFDGKNQIKEDISKCLLKYDNSDIPLEIAAMKSMTDELEKLLPEDGRRLAKSLHIVFAKEKESEE